MIIFPLPRPLLTPHNHPIHSRRARPPPRLPVPIRARTHNSDHTCSRVRYRLAESRRAMWVCAGTGLVLEAGVDVGVAAWGGGGEGGGCLRQVCEGFGGGFFYLVVGCVLAEGKNKKGG